MWLRQNKTEDHKGREEKIKQDKIRETNQKRLRKNDFYDNVYCAQPNSLKV